MLLSSICVSPGMDLRSFFEEKRMYNRETKKIKTQNNKNSLMTAILSLSLLPVMAGAAVAPALGTIREHF